MPPIQNGFFLDRVSFTIYFPTSFLYCKLNLPGVQKKYKNNPTIEDTSFHNSAGDIKIESQLFKEKITGQNILKYYIRLVKNLSMQCFFNGNAYTNEKHNLINSNNYPNYLHEFNMIPKHPSLNLPKYGNILLKEQLIGLKKYVWELYYFYIQKWLPILLLPAQINEFKEKHIMPKISFGSVEICKDYSNSSYQDWITILNDIQAKSDARNSSLTHYQRWWLTKEEKRKITELGLKTGNISDELMVPRENWSYCIDSNSNQKKNQIHFYQKMVSQSRFELQCNKDAIIDNVLYNFIWDKFCLEDTAAFIKWYAVGTFGISGVNFSKQKTTYCTEFSILQNFATSFRLDSNVILLLIESKDLSELLNYQKSDSASAHKAAKKRNQKLSKIGLIKWDPKNQRYMKSEMLNYLVKQLRSSKKNNVNYIDNL